MSDAEFSSRISDYIRGTFLDGDSKSELEETTPLLEWGILNSMNTALLLNFVRDELGVTIPATMINAENFKNVKNIAAMISGLTTASRA